MDDDVELPAVSDDYWRTSSRLAELAAVLDKPVPIVGREAIPFGDAWKVRVIPAEAGLLVSLVSGSAKGMPWAWFNES